LPEISLMMMVTMPPSDYFSSDLSWNMKKHP
jgi:hypothetical protein